MIEKSIIKCKICGLDKTRILVGKYPNNNNKKYVDENGKQFNGKVCPSCQAERTKHKMKVMRFTRELNKKEGTDE